MTPFAELLDRLSYTPGRNAKIRLLQAYLRSTPDPDRGWALAALTDGLLSKKGRRTRMTGFRVRMTSWTIGFAARVP